MTEMSGSEQQAVAAPSAGDRLVDDMAAVVREEMQRLRGELTETARRAGVGGLMLGAAAGCCLLAIGAGSTTALRIVETFLPRRLAPFGLTAGYLAAAAVLGTLGLERLRAAGGTSEHVADEVRRAVNATLHR